MRLIKFRAWDRTTHKDGIMVSWEELKQFPCEVVFLPLSEVTLMRYIGLKDKNEIQIYKDDIVIYGKFALNDEKFGNEPWKNLPDGVNEDDITTELDRLVVNDEIKFLYHFEKLITDSPDVLGIKIIGNIHQNPEMRPA